MPFLLHNCVIYSLYNLIGVVYLSDSGGSCHNFVAEKEKELGQHITFFMLLSFYELRRENSDTHINILGFATILDVLGRPQCFVNTAWVGPSELV